MCGHIFDVQVHWSNQGTYHLYRSITAYMLISVANTGSLGNIEWQCQDMRHRLADSWLSHSFYRHVIEVQVHRRIPGICLELCYNRSSTAYLPIPFGKKTVSAILSTSVRLWDTARLFVAKLQLSLAYHSRCETTPALHPRESDAETRLGYSWPNYGITARVYPDLWLMFTNNWDLQSSQEWHSWIVMEQSLTSRDSW